MLLPLSFGHSQTSQIQNLSFEHVVGILLILLCQLFGTTTYQTNIQNFNY